MAAFREICSTHPQHSSQIYPVPAEVSTAINCDSSCLFGSEPFNGLALSIYELCRLADGFSAAAPKSVPQIDFTTCSRTGIYLVGFISLA